MTPPPDVPPDPATVARLAPLAASPRSTALLTDFDGTLAPIVDDPATVRALPGAVEVLGRLAGAYGLVAVVSGRPVSFLADRLAGADGVHLVGLYGLEQLAAGGAVVPVADAERWRPVVAGVAGRMLAVAPEGAWVEPKGLTVTVHWRMAPGWEDEAVGLLAAEAAATGLEAHPGRMSVELRPPLDVDKGTAVAALVAGYRAACFLGDDLGDLPAFAALDRLASADGMMAVTVAAVDAEAAPEVAAAATVSVTGPAGALAVLRWLADTADGS